MSLCSKSARRTGVLAIAGVIMLSGLASAATIDATFAGINPSQSLTLWSQGVGQLTTSAGAFNWLRTGGDWQNPPLVNDAFITFCIELVQSIQSGQNYTYTVADLSTAPVPHGAPLNGPMGDVKAGYIEELWATRFNTLVTADDFAAMQTTVWELVYDTDLDLTTGTFKAITVAPFVTLAQTFLDGLTGTPPQGTVIKAMTSPNRQDQTFLTTMPTPSAALAVLPLLLFGALRRR